MRRAGIATSRSAGPTHEPVALASWSPDAGGCAAEAGFEERVSLGDASNVARVQLGMPRRSRQVTFSCNKCGSRTTRKVNPIAWDRGMVFVQCAGCEAWHNIRDEMGLIEEVRFTSDSSSESDQGSRDSSSESDEGS
ncbi:hypothetical protein WJX81_003288 [Elliptochloris bilobata]|uniref:DNL-type domain-containing protein n=1 Tax=Elliptochloris bilobata TaxID=381761 RepID=A0AAW1RKP5_9CHLO